jgi:hypothetical protein
MFVILATWDQCSLPAQVNSSQDHVSKITRTKWTGGMAQVASVKP